MSRTSGSCRLTGGAPAALTGFTEGLIDGLEWAADGRSLLFVREGVMMRVAREGGTAQPVWSGSPIGDVALSPDRAQVAFVRDGDLFVRALSEGGERQLTREVRDVSGPVWSLGRCADRLHRCENETRR